MSSLGRQAYGFTNKETITADNSYYTALGCPLCAGYGLRHSVISCRNAIAGVNCLFARRAPPWLGSCHGCGGRSHIQMTHKQRRPNAATVVISNSKSFPPARARHSECPGLVGRVRERRFDFTVPPFTYVAFDSVCLNQGRRLVLSVSFLP